MIEFRKLLYPGNFYPRSPCGERRWLLCYMILARLYFYPRSPCGERPRKSQRSRARIGISIHALLAESDFVSVCLVYFLFYFYPRSPCGERLSALAPKENTTQFLSTLSLRRATWPTKRHLKSLRISIHALLAESDNVCPHIRRFYAISIHALLAESDN